MVVDHVVLMRTRCSAATITTWAVERLCSRSPCACRSYRARLAQRSAVANAAAIQSRSAAIFSTTNVE